MDIKLNRMRKMMTIKKIIDTETIKERLYKVKIKGRPTRIKLNTSRKLNRKAAKNMFFS